MSARRALVTEVCTVANVPRVLVLLLGALLLVGSSGCGGEEGAGAGRSKGPLTKPEYERRFKAVVKSAESEIKSAEDRDQRAQAAAAFRGFDELAEDLDALHPPVEARRAHADFVAALRGLVALQRPAFDALARGAEDEAERLYKDAIPSELRAKALSARRYFAANDYDLAMSSSGLP